MADLYVDSSIFQAELKHSCYYGKMVMGHSDDWVFEQDENGRIIRVGKMEDFNSVVFMVQGERCENHCRCTEAYNTRNIRESFWMILISR